MIVSNITKHNAINIQKRIRKQATENSCELFSLAGNDKCNTELIQ